MRELREPTLTDFNMPASQSLMSSSIGVLSFDASCATKSGQLALGATLLEALNRHRGTAVQTKDRPVEGGLWNRYVES